MQNSKWSKAIGLLTIVSSLLAACGPQAAPTQAPQGTPLPPATVLVTSIVAGTSEVVVVTATPEPVTQPEAGDPETLVHTTFGDVDTMDPALAYDTSSAQAIMNTHDQLITFEREKVTSFVPMLAEEVPSVENGGISDDGMTYTFNIREGVTFHDGSELTAEDVAYTFQRAVLQGGGSSPQFLIAEPLFGSEAVPDGDITDLVIPDGSLLDNIDGLKGSDAEALAAACQQVLDRITVDGNAVTFHLAVPWGPMIPTLAQSWGSVISKAWAIENGAWDGDCATWQNFYGATSEQLNATKLGSSENGTGPYMLDHWTPGEELVFKANENYWLKEPLWEGGPSGAPAIKTVIIKEIDEFSTRLAMVQAQESDFITLGSQADYPLIDPLVGEECDEAGNCTVTDPSKPLRVFKGLESTARTDIFMNFNVTTEGGNNFIGSGQLDGNGIPPDFFSDVHVRRAFAYCFDWETYIAEAQNGEGVQSYNVMLPGMVGYDEASDHYSFDLDKCKEEFDQSTWTSEDGRPLSEVGFRLTVGYNTGNTARQTVAEILQANLNQVNELYVLEATGLPWPTYLRNFRAGTLPISVSGWAEDIHDPHNWVVPYGVGTFAGRQNMPAELRDQFREIINRGVAATDEAERAEIYKEFNQLYYDQVPTILLSVSKTRHYEQRYVNGWYYNAIGPGNYWYAYNKASK